MESEFVYDETSEKSWEEQAGEYNATLLEIAEATREKSEIEILRDTVDMLLMYALGGDLDV